MPEDAFARLERRRLHERYGDVSVVPTKAFLYGLETDEEPAVNLEPGVRFYIELEAITDPDYRGIRTLLFAVNDQSCPVDAQDTRSSPRFRCGRKRPLASPDTSPRR